MASRGRGGYDCRGVQSGYYAYDIGRPMQPMMVGRGTAAPMVRMAPQNQGLMQMYGRQTPTTLPGMGCPDPMAYAMYGQRLPVHGPRVGQQGPGAVPLRDYMSMPKMNYNDSARVTPYSNNISTGRDREFPVSMYDPRSGMAPARTATMRSLNGQTYPASQAPGEPPKLTGFGEITWLSSKAGVITDRAKNCTISFQLKDFCDQSVVDLIAFLRLGFTMHYEAAHSGDDNKMIASMVTPLERNIVETACPGFVELDLEDAERRGALDNPPKSKKDMYFVALETKALHLALKVYNERGEVALPMSILHAQFSPECDPELKTYVGTSSMKRRQFVEKRNHIFCGDPKQQDIIVLQPPFVYNTVTTLARFLLCKGGVSNIAALHEYYLGCSELAEERQQIQLSMESFVAMLEEHKFIFAVFPSKNWVSVRRNLPALDYESCYKQIQTLRTQLNRPPSTQYPVAQSPMLNLPSPLAASYRKISEPAAPVSLMNSQVTASDVFRNMGGSIDSESQAVSCAFPVSQATTNNTLADLAMTFDQSSVKRSVSTAQPPNSDIKIAWNNLLGLSPDANDFDASSLFQEIAAEMAVRTLDTPSHSSLCSPFGDASVFTSKTLRSAKDVCCQTEERTGSNEKLLEQILLELCPGCAKTIADRFGLPASLTDRLNNLSLGGICGGNLVMPPTQILTGTRPTLASITSDSNSAVTNNSSPSSTSVASPNEDIRSLSSGTPTMVESCLDHDGRGFDSFNPMMYPQLLDSRSAF